MTRISTTRASMSRVYVPPISAPRGG